MYSFSYRYATIPIRIASVCREIHAALTGPKARQSPGIDEGKLHRAWETLDQCWKDFDGLRQLGTDGFLQAEDIERFIDGWQIFVFECHNVIREALKQRLVAQPVSENTFLSDSNPSMRGRASETVVRLHSKANTRCQAVIRHVVSILRRNLGTQFFQFDAALIRDGCFYAGFLLAAESGNGDDIETCLQALREMRWTFSKSEDREQTLRMVWESRLTQTRSRSFSNSPTDDLVRLSTIDFPFARRPLARPISVPPLSLSLCTIPSVLASTSAPSTACSSSTDWPTTTPPSSAGTGMYDGLSNRESPTSPFAHSPHGLGVDPLQAKAGLVGPSSLMLGDSAHTSRGDDSAALENVFLFNYGGLGDSADNHAASQSPTSLAAPTADYTSTQYFDASGVVFSNPTISQQSGCSTNLTSTASGVNGDGRQFADSSFYH